LSQIDENVVLHARALWIAKNNLSKMRFIYDKLGYSIHQSGDEGKLVPSQEFALAFFLRSFSYLFASLSCLDEYLYSPCRDLLRTTYEMIYKGFFFSLRQDKAIDAYIKIQTGDEKALEVPIRTIINELYQDQINTMHHKFYTKICPYSHADLIGANLNYRFFESEYKDCLQLIISAEYGFFAMIHFSLKKYFDEQLLKELDSIVQEMQPYNPNVPIFYPNKVNN